MTVSQDGVRLECEFRHLSLAEYLTALHVHVTGDNLLGKKYVKFVKLLQAYKCDQSISRVFEYNFWRDFCVRGKLNKIMFWDILKESHHTTLVHIFIPIFVLFRIPPGPQRADIAVFVGFGLQCLLQGPAGCPGLPSRLGFHREKRCTRLLAASPKNERRMV